MVNGLLEHLQQVKTELTYGFVAAWSEGYDYEHDRLRDLSFALSDAEKIIRQKSHNHS